MEAQRREVRAGESGQERDLEFGSSAVCVVEDVEWGGGGAVIQRGQEEEKKKREAHLGNADLY